MSKNAELESKFTKFGTNCAEFVSIFTEFVSNALNLFENLLNLPQNADFELKFAEFIF